MSGSAKAVNQGGKRVGAGRKKGTANKKTREIADRAAAEGITPLEYMLEVMRDPKSKKAERMSMAIAAAPYMHPRLSQVKVDADVRIDPLEDLRKEIESSDEGAPGEKIDEAGRLKESA